MDSFLTQYRREAGFTQNELCARSGLTLATIQRLEAGFGLLLRSHAVKLGQILSEDPKDIFPALNDKSKPKSKTRSFTRRLDVVEDDENDPQIGTYANFCLAGGHVITQEISPATRKHLEVSWKAIRKRKYTQSYIVFNGLTERVAINVAALEEFYTYDTVKHATKAGHNAECFLLNGKEKALTVNPDEYLVDTLWDEYQMLGVEGDQETPLQNTFYDLIKPATKWVSVTNTEGRRHILTSRNLVALCVSQTAFGTPQRDACV